jgi:hypothetical protein
MRVGAVAGCLEADRARLPRRRLIKRRRLRTKHQISKKTQASRRRRWKSWRRIMGSRLT